MVSQFCGAEWRYPQCSGVPFLRGRQTRDKMHLTDALSTQNDPAVASSPLAAKRFPTIAEKQVMFVVQPSRLRVGGWSLLPPAQPINNLLQQIVEHIGLLHHQKMPDILDDHTAEVRLVLHVDLRVRRETIGVDVTNGDIHRGQRRSQLVVEELANEGGADLW